MKKIFAILTIAVLMLSFAGCGSKKETKVPVIGISQYGDHASLDNWRVGFLEGLKEA